MHCQMSVSSVWRFARSTAAVAAAPTAIRSFRAPAVCRRFGFASTTRAVAIAPAYHRLLLPFAPRRALSSSADKRPAGSSEPARPAASTEPVFTEPVPSAPPKADAGAAGAAGSDGGGSSGPGSAPPVSWTNLLVTALIGSGFILYYNYDKKSRMVRGGGGGGGGAAKLDAPRTVGTPDVGGPFDLIDSNDKRVTDSDLIGRYTLVYFGFTNCPDVCPTELKKMERALNELDKKGIAAATGGITPLFISIDPKRDTPSRFRAYASEYHPRTIWLTGSEEQISRVAKSYRIYWSVPPNASDQYLVDHSIFFFLMDRNGKYLSFYGKNSTAEEVVASITKLVTADEAKPFVARPRTEPPPPPPIVKPAAFTPAKPKPAPDAATAAPTAAAKS